MKFFDDNEEPNREKEREFEEYVLKNNDNNEEVARRNISRFKKTLILLCDDWYGERVFTDVAVINFKDCGETFYIKCVIIEESGCNDILEEEFHTDDIKI